MYKTLNEKGFTIIELLVGFSIGIIVLTGLLSFFFRTSKMINAEQTSAASLTQLQFVMNKIVQDIKEANTQAPGTGSTVTDAVWAQLPHLPYGRTFTKSIIVPTDADDRISPSYPVAYDFLVQALKAGAPCGWYPKGWGGKVCSESTECQKMNIDKPIESSNELAFYKVRQDGTVIRVLYYTEKDPSDHNSDPDYRVLRIRKKQQIGIISTSINFDATDISTTDDVVLSGVKSLQFTYPNLSKRLDAESDDLDLNLCSSITGTDHEKNKIMNPYRDTIGIRIITGREQIGQKRATALELYTEVNVRN